MPNVIDSLIVTLGLDSKQFTEAQKKAVEDLKKTGDEAEKQRKRHEDQAKRTAEAYGKVRDSILGVTAAVVSAVAGGELLQFLTKNDTAAANLAKNVGSTAKEVSLLQGVFRQLGASTGDADSFLRTTNKIIQDLRMTGSSSALLPFAQAGLNTAAFRDAKSMQERMQMLSDTAKKMDPQKAQYLLQNAGYSEETINILLQTRKSLGEVFDAQKKLNVLSQEDINLAFDRQFAWAQFNEQLTGASRKIVNEISPIWTKFIESVTKFIGYVTSDAPAATALIIGIAAAVGKLAAAFGFAGAGASALLSKLSLYAAAAAGIYEVVHLLSSLAELLGVSTRGNILTKDTQDRIKNGALNNVEDPFHKKPTVSDIFSNQGTADSASLFSSLESKYGLPSGLLDQMWRKESGRGRNMLSPAGAKGHFQFMDATAAEYGLKNPYDLNESANAAARYMQKLISLNHGDVAGALASYNEGFGNYTKGRMPLETSDYVRSIMGGMQSARVGGGGAGVTIQNMTVTSSSPTLSGVGADVGRGMQSQLYAQNANTGVN